MVRLRAVTWAGLSWGWVALPLVGMLPGIPTRLSAVWLWMAWSLLILVWDSLSPARGKRSIWGWLAGGALLLAVTGWRTPTPAFWWVTNAVVVCLAAGVLVAHQQFRHLRRACLCVLAFQAGLVMWQGLGFPSWWPHLAGYTPLVGTVGSVSSVAILLGVGVLWSTAWGSWGFLVASALTGSGTVLPFLLLWTGVKRSWPVASLGACWSVLEWKHQWWLAFQSRWEVWRGWKWTWMGGGFTPFPGGFQDDTDLGRQLVWRDYHNVWLDWMARFGFLGALVAVGVVAWWWRRSRTSEARWLFAYCLWVSCWQSVEQFPMLLLPLLVWWIGLAQEGATDARSSVS